MSKLTAADINCILELVEMRQNEESYYGVQADYYKRLVRIKSKLLAQKPNSKEKDGHNKTTS